MSKYLLQAMNDLGFLPKQRKKKYIKHHETCPACGSRLVNIYNRDGEWKCKKCWDHIDTLRNEV